MDFVSQDVTDVKMTMLMQKYKITFIKRMFYCYGQIWCKIKITTC